MKKKIIALATALTLAIAACACGGTDSTDTTDTASADEAAATDEAEEETEQAETEQAAAATEATDEMMVFEQGGITLPYPPTYLANKDKVTIFPYENYVKEAGVCYVMLVAAPEGEEALKAMDEAEQNEIIARESCLALYFGVNDGRDETIAKDIFYEDYLADNYVKIGTADDYTFYRGEYTDIAKGTDTERAEIIQQIRKEIYAADTTITKPTTEEEKMVGNVLSFETKDLDGNAVSSSELFAKNKVTMLNIWTSWCTYCVTEMADLAEINDEYADKGVAVVGLLYDSDEDGAVETAKDLLEENGGTYTNIMITDDLKSQLTITAFPTTIFVDSEGNIVGSPIVGQNIEAYRSALDELTAD